jgi:hypothetical protein
VAGDLGELVANLQQVPAEKVPGVVMCGLTRYGIQNRNKGEVLFMDIWVWINTY